MKNQVCEPNSSLIKKIGFFKDQIEILPSQLDGSGMKLKKIVQLKDRVHKSTIKDQSKKDA